MKNIFFIIIAIIAFSLNTYGQCNGTIDGMLIDENGENMAGIEIALLSNLNILETIVTDDQGTFSIPLTNASSNTSNLEIRITSNSPDPINGVSTLDLVIIQRHILGIVPLDAQVNIAQADVNCDGNITAIDLLMIRRLILGLDRNFPGGDYCGVSDQVDLRNISISNCEVQNITGPLVITAFRKGNVTGN